MKSRRRQACEELIRKTGHDTRRFASTNKINVFAVGVAAVAAFACSSLYYSPLVTGGALAAGDPVYAGGLQAALSTILIEIVRTFGVTYVFARLIARLGKSGWIDSVQLGLWLWFGFSFLMWVGAVIWEKQPWQVAAIHSGDWLVKILLVASIYGVWTARSARHGA